MASDRSSSDTDRLRLAATNFFDAVCPHCDRKERFNDELTARAWMTGHIQEEHEGELPRYEGTGGEQ